MVSASGKGCGGDAVQLSRDELCIAFSFMAIDCEKHNNMFNTISLQGQQPLLIQNIGLL